jgi:phenylalanyl-tRNA synthetase alpha chain
MAEKKKKQGAESTDLEAELLALLHEAQKAFEQGNESAAIEALKVQYLGKKGTLQAALKQIGGLDEVARPLVGKVANEVRSQIELAHTKALERLNQKLRSSVLAESIDVTLPGRRYLRGRPHILTETMDLMLSVLSGLGFEAAFGPEIEHDFYNFEALNIPKDHPARDMQDTFYLDKDVVLRTHTSPIQIRTMLSLREPPIRIAAAGRVFRREHDGTHSPVFHQVEGLYVDSNVTFGDLKGTLEAFVRELFAKDTKVRMRPSYFPFTEPSAEVDMSCFACKGSGCRLCKGTGFIEILGAGMVDPEVFKAVGYDSEAVSGFAFGIGVERVAMLRYAISDIRSFYENDIRFLSQF